GGYSVYFEVSRGSGGPWTVIDQQDSQYTWPEGISSVSHVFTETNIPTDYAWYRVRLHGSYYTHGTFEEVDGQTPATSICSPLTVAGHLTWQGIPQPDTRNVGITGTLTLCSAGT